MISICAIAAWNCSGSHRAQRYSITEKITSTDIFSLPHYRDDKSPVMDRFRIGVVKRNDSILTIEIFPPARKKNGLVYHYFTRDSIPGYYSDAYILAGCRYTDSLLISDRTVFVSKDCSNYKENMVFRQLAPDTVMVSRYFYNNTALSSVKGLAYRDSWAESAEQIRTYYLVKGSEKMEYTCLQPIDIFCPADFLNLGSATRPNSFFWHFIYVSHFSRY